MIRIILVDDHLIVRDGIKNLIETNPEYSVVSEATNVNDAITLLHKIKTDLLITDIALENSNGIYLTRQARVLFPNLRILVLSMHNAVDYINESLASGANGYLLKDCTKQELYEAITKTLNNETYVCKSSCQVLMNNSLKNGATDINNDQLDKKDIQALTRREIQVLKLISQGYINKEIAGQLSLSVRTVDKHRFNILHKFHVNNTAELLHKAAKMKLLSMAN
jgi:DNA-binding NarL/FixJ family response regulator